MFVNLGDKSALVAFDARTGRVLSTLPAGDNIDATAFDPATRLAFASAGDGTLTVARDESAVRVFPAGVVATGRGGKTMALDLRTHRVYVPVAQYGTAPAPTAAAPRPRPRPPMIPSSFTVLVLDR